MSLCSDYIESRKSGIKKSGNRRRWLRRPLFERIACMEEYWRSIGESAIREEMESRILVRYPVKIVH